MTKMYKDGCRVSGGAVAEEGTMSAGSMRSAAEGKKLFLWCVDPVFIAPSLLL